VPYPLASSDDLAETATEVETPDRRIVTREADVRDVAAVVDAVISGSSQGLSGRDANGSGALEGYVGAKHGVVG